MAKQSRSVRANHLSHHRGRGASFEQHESYDDSLLPDATELAKLKELDPEIIGWIKERTEKEQDSRLDFNNRKIRLVEGAEKRNYQIDIITILCAFFIIMGAMWFSYFLIVQKQVITGTIFAGATIAFAANSFLSFRKKSTPEKKNEEGS